MVQRHLQNACHGGILSPSRGHFHLEQLVFRRILQFEGSHRRRQLERLRNALAPLKTRKVLGVLSEKRLRRQALLSSGQVTKLEKSSDFTEFEQAFFAC
jgi:hypothetical protein